MEAVRFLFLQHRQRRIFHKNSDLFVCRRGHLYRNATPDRHLVLLSVLVDVLARFISCRTPQTCAELPSSSTVSVARFRLLDPNSLEGIEVR